MKLLTAVFVYVCLALLPASAMASCSRVVQALFFDALDTNKDNEVQRTEAEAFVKALEVNGDTCLTLAEAKARIPTVARQLEGHEEPLYGLFDLDKNNCITKSDLDGAYLIMDTNRNNAVSRPEYQTALGAHCFIPNIISSLLKILSTGNV